jgi:hypothetical protein
VSLAAASNVRSRRGEPVVFELTAGGRVARLKVGEKFMTPVAEQ